MTVRIQSTEEQTTVTWADAIPKQGLVNIVFGHRPQTVIFNNMGVIGFHSFEDSRPVVLDIRDVAAVEIMGFLDYKPNPELFKHPLVKEFGEAVKSSTALFFFKKDGTRHLFSVNNNPHDGNLQVITALKSAFDEATGAIDENVTTEEFTASAVDVFRQLAGEQTRAGLISWADFAALGLGSAVAAFGLIGAKGGGASAPTAALFFLAGAALVWRSTADLWRLVALRWLRLLLWPAPVQLGAVVALCGGVVWYGLRLFAEKTPEPWRLAFTLLLLLALLVGFVRAHRWAALGLLIGRPLDMPRGFGPRVPVWRSLFVNTPPKRGHKWAHLFVFIMGPLALFGVTSDFFGWISSSEEQKLGHITWLIVVWLVVLYYGPAVFKEKG